jgi:hypothetical protein
LIDGNIIKRSEAAQPIRYYSEIFAHFYWYKYDFESEQAQTAEGGYLKAIKLALNAIMALAFSYGIQLRGLIRYYDNIRDARFLR